MKSTPSKIKLPADGFNGCPARADIKDILKPLEPFIKFVDVDQEYWKNDLDVMVFSISGDLGAGLLLAEATTNLNADEFNFVYDTANKIYYVRMWWD